MSYLSHFCETLYSSHDVRLYNRVMNVIPSSLSSLTVPSLAYRVVYHLTRSVIVLFLRVSVYNTSHTNSLSLNHLFSIFCNHYNLANHLFYLLPILRYLSNLYTVTSILFIVYLVLYFNVLSQNLYSVPNIHNTMIPRQSSSLR